MIDFQKIQDTLREWFCNASGIPAFWFGEEVENEEKPYCELQIGSTDGLGIDETRETFNPSEPGREVVRCQSGNRLFILSCRAKSRDQRPNYAARFYLEKVRTALSAAWSKAIFQENNLAFVEALPLVNLDEVFQDRQQSRALLEVQFATAVNVADPHDAGGYIAKTLVSSDYKDAGGTSLPADLRLDDKEMP